MTKPEALKLLESAPCSEILLSKVNKNFTQAQAVDIVRRGILSQYIINEDTVQLDWLTEKRVWQVVKNRKRVKF